MVIWRSFPSGHFRRSVQWLDRRPRLRIGLGLLLIFVLVPTYSGESPRLILGGPAQMIATRVQLDASDPARTRVGALTFLGGISLTSADPAFGGFSSMRVEGDRFTLLSDGGNLVRFHMGADFRPHRVIFGDLASGPGSGWAKSDRDSESMTGNPATGQWWVGFEQSNEIWRYGRDGVAQAHYDPVRMRNWSINGGPESLVRLRSGEFVTISETSRPRDDRSRTTREGFFFQGDPTNPRIRVTRFAYLPPRGYDPTDMAELPDGRLLVLNRKLNLSPALFTAKLVILDRIGLAPGALAEGREIASFAPPLIHDNFEAIAVTREGRDVIVWIASDDNRAFFERSLLLKFRLEFGR